MTTTPRNDPGFAHLFPPPFTGEEDRRAAAVEGTRARRASGEDVR